MGLKVETMTGTPRPLSLWPSLNSIQNKQTTILYTTVGHNKGPSKQQYKIALVVQLQYKITKLHQSSKIHVHFKVKVYKNTCLL